MCSKNVVKCVIQKPIVERKRNKRGKERKKRKEKNKQETKKRRGGGRVERGRGGGKEKEVNVKNILYANGEQVAEVNHPILRWFQKEKQMVELFLFPLGHETLLIEVATEQAALSFPQRYLCFI